MEIFDDEVEADESCFSGQRKGKRGCGAAGKVAVFGILKRQGKVFTLVVENTKQDTLLPVMKRKIMSDNIVYTDCCKRYDVLDVASIIRNCLQTVKTTSTALKTPGIRQSAFCESIMELTVNLFVILERMRISF